MKGSLAVRIAASLGVAFLQLVGANLFTFVFSMAFPQMNPDTNQGFFVTVAGLAFFIGIAAVGLLAVRFRWLPGPPAYPLRTVLALAGVYIPLALALVLGQVREASPFFLISMLGGIVGFHLAGWVSR
jgi:hypothetical protein